MNKKAIQKGVSQTASGVGRVGKNFANQGWSALPVWAKGAIFVVVGFGVYRVIRFVGKQIGKTKLNEPSRDSQQAIEGWFDNYLKDNAKSPAVMTKGELKDLANKIWYAMDGYGTRDASLIRMFKQVTSDADFSGLSMAYGTRDLQPGHWVGWMLPAFRGTMLESIQNEADEDTIVDINKGLKARGVRYFV